jgi:hypothetical protein
MNYKSGGITGVNPGSNGGVCLISNCYVTADTKNVSSGGIAGVIHPSARLYIYNCYDNFTIIGNHSEALGTDLWEVTNGLIDNGNYSDSSPTIYKANYAIDIKVNADKMLTNVTVDSLNLYQTTYPLPWRAIFDSSGGITGYPKLSVFYDITTIIPLISTICFPGHTLVKTDQGLIRFDNIDCSVNTINGYKITNVTRTTSSSKTMVCIPRGSFRTNVPNLDTEITHSHKVVYNGNLVCAGKLVGVVHGIHLIPYDGNPVYNIVLEDDGIMVVHNMLCETLSPTNLLNSINLYVSTLFANEANRFICEHNKYMSSINLHDIKSISEFTFTRDATCSV